MPGPAGPAAQPAAPPSTDTEGTPQLVPPRVRAALSFTVRQDAVGEAARVLTDYPSPQTEVNEYTRLLATTVFLGGNRVLRIADVTGDLGAALRHLSSQPAIREVERRLDPLLTEPRDLTDPAGARAFFSRAMMRCSSAATDGCPLTGPLPRHRWAALLPVPEGSGPRAAELLTAIRPATVTAGAVHRDDAVVWLLEGDRRPDELPAAACAEPAVRDTWRPLLELLAPALDEESRGLDLPDLLARWAMRRVTDRRAS
ncbi:SchA/CurD-like domain-containing protein [Streptomyces sp. 8N706]|uniref:SchA/CurD-like domain-containing protein n=1 Tax=Streptomyces sp. 8N706 TaxID=3457416 RepID=UPI003FD3586B